MTELSLFSGAGGGLLGSKLLGWRCVGYVESDDYCRGVLRARIRDGTFDDAPIFDDVRTFDGMSYRGRVDIVTAGFPCTPWSHTGDRKGEGDERNLWPDTLRIIREVRPRFVYLENVPGLLASHGYFGTILAGLAESGFDARWKVVSAADVGAPHIRARLWILAYVANADVGRCLRPRISNEWRSALCDLARGRETLADAAELSERESANETEPESDCGNAREELSGRGWWAFEPSVGRVANGVAHRPHRLRAIGNGQVPICMARAFLELSGEVEKAEQPMKER